MQNWFLAIALFLLGCSSKEQVVIGIQPYGDMDKILIESISVGLHHEYNARIVLLPKQSIPPHTFVNVKSPRYRADKLIRHLKETKPDTLDYILAITGSDISTTKKDVLGFTLKPKSKYEDWGVFGLGYMPGASCIVSTFRTQKTAPKNFILRMKKIAIHEIGHNMGLDHCDSDHCVMHDAVESISTVDDVNASLCDRCRHQIFE